MKAQFDWCPELIARTDWGHSSPADHKTICAMECKAEKGGRPCVRRGGCVVAHNGDDWSRINRKSFTPPTARPSTR